MSGGYNAGAIDAALRLDRSDFNRELSQAKRDAEEFQKQTYSPKVALDDSEAKRKIQELKAELQSLSNTALSVSLAGYDGAATHLTALQAQADHLSSTVITIRADVDTSAAIASLAAFRLLAEEDLNIRLDLDTRIAAASLAAFRAAADDNINIRADVDTSTAAASLAALRAAAGDPITIRTRTDGDNTPDGLPGNGDGDRNGGNGGSFGLKSLMSLPGLIAAVAPQIPALTTLLGGATAAAVSFGVAAGGAMGIYGAATMGAVKAATAHQKAVTQTEAALARAQDRLAHTTAGTQAYKDALVAVTQAEEAHKKAVAELTPVEKQFGNTLEQVKGTWQAFIGATETYTLKPVITALQAAKAAIPQLTPLVKELAPGVQQVADGFKGWVSDGGLQRFLGFIRVTGIPILKNMYLGLMGLLTAGGSLMRTFGPVAVQFSAWFKNMGDSVATWSNNGGAERFRVRFTKSWHQLKPIFSELMTFARHVWDLLNGTGQANGSALADVLRGINTAVGNVKPAAVKAFSEIFMSISDVAVTLAPVIGTTAKAIVDIVNALPAGTIRAIADAMIAWKLAVLGWNAAIIVWGVLTSIIEGLELAWVTLNFVFAASPIGFIITLVVGLIAVIVLIATKTTWFQTIWHYMWEGIKTASLWTWNNILKPVFANMWTGLKQIGTAALWLWTNGIKPVWDQISAASLWLWGYLKPVFLAIGTAFEFVGKWIWKIYTTYLKVVWILFEAAVKALWVFVLKPVFEQIKKGFQQLGEGIQWAWAHVIKPTWHAVADLAGWLWKNGIKPQFDAIKAGWDQLTDGLKSGWTHGIKPVWNAVSNATESLYKNHIKPTWSGIANTIGDKWDVIRSTVFSPMKTYFTKTVPSWGNVMKDKLIQSFDLAWKGIKVVWDNVKKAIGDPVYMVAKYVWNDALVGIMSKISSFVHEKNPLGKIPTDNIPHFAAGGPVPHTPGSTPGKDSVLSYLMPDEHVLTRDDVSAMGGQSAVMQFRSALHGGAQVQGANDTGHFGVGGWIDTAVSSLTGEVGKALGNMADVVMGTAGLVINPVLNKAKSTINKLVPADGGWDTLVNKSMTKPIDWLKAFIDKQDSKAQSVGGVIPSGQHLAIINAAMKAAGVPPPGTKEAWQSGMNTLITRESGWNASAINNWDSNAKAGHPSQGLTQTIPGTFNAYVPASLRDRGILDPVANVAASIRYIVSTYGNISNVQQANANKAPKGYWTGTEGAAPGLAWVGEKGPELINFHGGETVYNNGDSMQMMRNGLIGSLHGYASGTAKQRRSVRAAYNERDEDVARRNAAQKKYNDAHTKYLNATTVKEQQAAKREMAKYEKRVEQANKEIATDNKLIKLNDKRYKAASNAVEQERKDAATLTAARKKVTAAKAAKRKKDLDAVRATAQNYIAQLKASIDEKIQVATDARSGYYSAAVQTGQLSGLTGNRAAGFSQQLAAKIKAIKDFQTNLHTLAKLGMSQALIQQIAAMGPDQGGSLAQSLARTTTKADASKLNSQYAELEKVSGQYADSAAEDGYGLSKLKSQSTLLSKTKVTVTAPHTIVVKMGDKTFTAYTESVVEKKVSEIVTEAGKKK